MLLGARQFFARRGAPTPPLPYDAEVEYLESTGTQWIDTGVNGASPCHIRLGATYTSSQDNAVLLGAANTSDLTNKALYAFGQYPTSYCFTRIGNLYQSYGSIPINSMSDVDIDVSASSVSVKIGNAQVLQLSISARQNVGASLYLFALNRNGISSFLSKAIVSYLKIEIDGVLVRDYIPVRFTNELGQSEGAMYDRVSGQLFRNQGTGNFIIGRDTNPISARSYVNDGLVAMWDGIENAGWGVHDAEATTWKDLIGSVDLIVSSNTTWFNDALGSASRLVNGVAYSSSYISSIGTIEACFDLSSDSENGSGRGLVCNTNSRAIMGGGLSRIRSRGEASVMTESTVGLITAFNTAVVYGQTSSADLIYFNGAAQQTVSTSGNWALLNRIRIGGTGNSANVAIIGKCHCVRLYSRALNADEIAHNYAIDKARFNLA